MKALNRDENLNEEILKPRTMEINPGALMGQETGNFPSRKFRPALEI